MPIKLQRETVYCMDNESFRYLAAVKHGVKYDEDEDRIFSASWEKAKLRQTDGAYHN